MAISSGIGLQEKYINDDTEKEQLQNFNTAVKTVIDTLDFISVSEKIGRVDFEITGKNDNEKKKNLTTFLTNVYEQAKKYESILDKKVSGLDKVGMKFDEQLFVLLEKTKYKKSKLGDLETELEGIFDLMNTEINILMKVVSGETEALRNDIPQDNKSKGYNVVASGSDVDDLASNLPEAIEDIDYKFDSQERQKRIAVLKETVPNLKKNTNKLFADFEDKLKEAINHSKGSDKIKLKRTLKKLKENKDGFKKEFFLDIGKLEKALASGNSTEIEKNYLSIERHLKKLDSILTMQEETLRANGVWDKFNTNPQKYFVYEGFVVVMPIGMRSIVDEWRQMGGDFDYIIDNLQTGIDPNVEYKTVYRKEYSYLGEALNSYREIRKYTKTDDKDKITDRYKGYKQFTTIKSISQQLDIKRTEIENLNWQDVDKGILMVIRKFLSGELTISDKFSDFRKEFKSGGNLESYDFGKRYKNDKFEAKREIYNFLKKMQTRLSSGNDVSFETRRILESLNESLTETDINASDIDNARIILMKDGLITRDNVIPFLCDFDSDGKITGADVDKKWFKKDTIDTGSVMGSQMLDMMRAYANTNLDASGHLNIIEGEKTNTMMLSIFTNILRDVEGSISDFNYRDIDKKSFSKGLEYEIKQIKSHISNSSYYPLTDFVRFLTAYPEFKGFLINAVKKDDVEVFMSMNNQIEEKEDISYMDGSIDQVYYEKIEQIWGKDSFKELQEKLDSETLSNVRTGFGKQIFRATGNILNIITSPSVDQAIRTTIIGALGISSKIFETKDWSQSEYKSLFGKVFDKISANVVIDPSAINSVLKKDDIKSGDILKSIGVWFGTDRKSEDSGDIHKSKFGFNLYDLTLMGSLGFGKQTSGNKLDLQSLGNLDTKAVKRRGMEGGISVPLLNLTNTRINASIGKDIDYVAGIEQQNSNEHRLMSYILGLRGNKISGYYFDVKNENGNLVQDGGLSYLWTESNLTKDKIKDSMNAYFANSYRFPKYSQSDVNQLKEKKKYLEEQKRKLEKKKSLNKDEKLELENINQKLDDVDIPLMLMNSEQIQKEIQSEITNDLSSLIAGSKQWKNITEVQKRLFIKQYMVAYMQGYLAVVKMRRQEDLANGGIKPGGIKLGMSISVRDILDVASASGVGPIGTIAMGFAKLRRSFVLGIDFKSYRMNYTVDASNMANNYDKVNRLEQRDLELSSLLNVVENLKEQLKLLGDIQISSGTDNKITITGKDLHKLNISYKPGVKNQFFYGVGEDGKEYLVIGNVGKLGTANYFKNDGVQVYLFLGNNRAVDTVKLSGYNTPSVDAIDEIGFEPKSVEIGQSGIDDLKSQVNLDKLFKTGNLNLSDAEKTIVKNKVLAWLNADPENIKFAKAGKITVSIDDANSNNTVDAGEVNIVWTKTADSSLLNIATDNKVSIEFNYTTTEIVPGYTGKEVSVNFENNITSNIDDQNRDDIASSEYENNNRKLFREYLAKASTVLDYNEAYKNLRVIFWSGNSGVSNLLTDNKTDEEKRLIVNEFKGIFATNIDAHKKNTLDIVITNHGKAFTNLDWNQGLNLNNIFSNLTDLRKSLITKIKNSADSSGNIEHKDITDNLFGYTAFYRTASGKDARKYSMTALGATRMLGNASEKIDKNDVVGRTVFSNQGIFFKNLENNKADLDDIVKQVNKALQKQDSDIIDLTKDEVLNLLKNPDKSLKLKNVKTGVDFTIKSDVDYLFYLLGECANESFGIKLKLKVDKEPGIREETVGGHAETSQQQNRGLILGGGMSVSDRNLGHLSEDGVTVQGAVPVNNMETRESSEQGAGITTGGDGSGINTGGNGTGGTGSGSGDGGTGSGVGNGGGWLGGG